ncbi:hypothetical protein RGQ29_000501 [Quercus rubra]|uniref:Uncharacterized protein n=1 Tax=Quercus rubra TaxID=3512 RepID=A0AAN7G4N9_QUERU|nr:hypothetical protein RGQ29_000501 [Quercus rubra]
METTSSSTPQKENSKLPPKRGQIKARIFESFVKKVVSTASKLVKIGGKGGCSESSASSKSTPPSSAYNSEANNK